jgi:hypothetical protein
VSPLGGYTVILPDGSTRTARRVTEMIRAGMPAPGLVEWQLRELAAWCNRNTAFADPKATIAQWRKESRHHADRGTRVHKWIAATLTGEDAPVLPRTETGFSRAFTEWMLEHGPEHGSNVAVEETRTTIGGLVAGTADAIIDGVLYDWKTVETHRDDHPFPEHITQLGAYASLDRRLDVDQPATQVDHTYLVCLARDGTFSEYEITRVEAIELWQAVEHVAWYVKRSGESWNTRERQVRT